MRFMKVTIFDEKKYRTRFSLSNQLIDYKKQVIITIITVNVNKYVN